MNKAFKRYGKRKWSNTRLSKRAKVKMWIKRGQALSVLTAARSQISEISRSEGSKLDKAAAIAGICIKALSCANKIICENKL